MLSNETVKLLQDFAAWRVWFPGQRVRDAVADLLDLIRATMARDAADQKTQGHALTGLYAELAAAKREILAAEQRWLRAKTLYREVVSQLDAVRYGRDEAAANRERSEAEHGRRLERIRELTTILGS